LVISEANTIVDDRSALRLQVAELGDHLRIVHEQQAVVAHGLVTLVAKSESAVYIDATNAETLNRHFTSVTEHARTALHDLRRAMNISLQGFDSVSAWPTLETVAELFAENEKAGLVIDFTETGTRFPLSASAELAVYRILHEALDNARRHGGPGTEVDVSMVWSTDGLSIKIEDDGVRAEARRAAALGEISEGSEVTIDSDQRALIEDTIGRGISEMKSRAASFDGVVVTQRVPGVGFSLTASFPSLRFALDPKISD
jgi:signal transduction histidine kinase